MRFAIALCATCALSPAWAENTVVDAMNAKCTAMLVFHDNPGTLRADVLLYYTGYFDGITQGKSQSQFADSYRAICLAEPTLSVRQTMTQTRAKLDW